MPTGRRICAVVYIPKEAQHEAARTNLYSHLRLKDTPTAILSTDTYVSSPSFCCTLPYSLICLTWVPSGMRWASHSFNVGPGSAWGSRSSLPSAASGTCWLLAFTLRRGSHHEFCSTRDSYNLSIIHRWTETFYIVKIHTRLCATCYTALMYPQLYKHRDLHPPIMLYVLALF